MELVGVYSNKLSMLSFQTRLSNQSASLLVC